MGFSRRRFLAQLGLGIAAAGLLPNGARAASVCKLPTGKQALTYQSFAGKRGALMARRFAIWLAKHATARDHAVAGLIFEDYDPGARRGTHVSPRASALAMLWHVQRDKVAAASDIADALLRWQQSRRGGAHARSFGAFPARIERDGDSWRASELYCAGDNLAVLEALTVLFERTHDRELLNASVGVGTWLSETMCKGHTAGAWAENHGAPMYSVDGAGAFDPTIHANHEPMWIHALGRLAVLAGEEAYCRTADTAIQFYRSGQHSSGAFLDHYDPGSPPRAYDPSGWQPASPGKVLAERTLRAALGACRAGYFAAARKCFEWIDVDKGRVPAIVSVDTGKAAFEPDPLYYDVGSTALYRQLAQWLGERKAALGALDFLRKVQERDGAYYARTPRLRKSSKLQSSAAGLWATADLSLAGARIA